MAVSASLSGCGILYVFIKQMPCGLASLLQVRACPIGHGPAVHFQQMAAQSARTAWATRGPPGPHANHEVRAQHPTGEMLVQMVR